MDQQRSDRRVDAAAERADDLAIAHLPANAAGRLLDERGHRPIAGAATDVEREVFEDLEAAVGVRDFRMEQQAVERALRVFHRRHRRVGAGRDDAKAGRRGRDVVAMAGPDAQLARDAAEKARPRVADLDHRVAELTMRRRRDASAQRVGHQLHAVADAEHGRAHLEHRGIRFRRAALGNALGPAREDDADRLSRAQHVHRRMERQNLAVDRQLAQPARDQLRELRAEVEDENRLM